MHRWLDASFIFYCFGFLFKKKTTLFTLLEVALSDFSESLLESDSDLESEELSSDELDSVSEELDVHLFLEVLFAFFLMSCASLHREKILRDMQDYKRNLLRQAPLLTF